MFVPMPIKASSQWVTPVVGSTVGTTHEIQTNEGYRCPMPHHHCMVYTATRAVGAKATAMAKARRETTVFIGLRIDGRCLAVMPISTLLELYRSNSVWGWWM
jgi:hypothetical protein